MKFPSFDKVQRILIKNKQILKINSNINQKKTKKNLLEMFFDKIIFI